MLACRDSSGLLASTSLWSCDFVLADGYVSKGKRCCMHMITTEKHSMNDACNALASANVWQARVSTCQLICLFADVISQMGENVSELKHLRWVCCSGFQVHIVARHVSMYRTRVVSGEYLRR